jgi:hypothetical protein
MDPNRDKWIGFRYVAGLPSKQKPAYTPPNCSRCNAMWPARSLAMQSLACGFCIAIAFLLAIRCTLNERWPPG